MRRLGEFRKGEKHKAEFLTTRIQLVPRKTLRSILVYHDNIKKEKHIKRQQDTRQGAAQADYQ